MTCVKHTLPGATTEMAVNSFRKRFKISEKDLPSKTCEKICERMEKEFDSMLREHGSFDDIKQ